MLPRNHISGGGSWGPATDRQPDGRHRRLKGKKEKPAQFHNPLPFFRRGSSKNTTTLIFERVALQNSVGIQLGFQLPSLDPCFQCADFETNPGSAPEVKQTAWVWTVHCLSRALLLQGATLYLSLCNVVRLSGCPSIFYAFLDVSSHPECPTVLQ